MKSNTARRVRLFRFTVGGSAKVERFEIRVVREARKKITETPIKDFLEGVLSEVLIDTMVDRGFFCIGDIWPNSENVRKLVPSYGKAKDRRVQDLINNHFKAQKAK